MSTTTATQSQTQSPAENKMTGAQILWASLEREGVQTVFGYPGGAILPVYDALKHSAIRHILVRHEQGATHMADGFARASSAASEHTLRPNKRMAGSRLAPPIKCIDADDLTVRRRSWSAGAVSREFRASGPVCRAGSRVPPIARQSHRERTDVPAVGTSAACMSRG